MGIADTMAWKVALYAYAPINGGPGELIADPDFEEIAAGWQTGKYKIEAPGFAKFPSGATNFQKLAVEPTDDQQQVIEAINNVGKKITDKWRHLASQIPAGRVANELTVMQWAFQNAGIDPDRIDPEGVPSLGSVRYLQWVQNNYDDFIKNNWTKLVPDRKALEYQQQLTDDGRSSFTMIDEFLESLEDEEPGEPVEDGVEELA